MQNLVQLATGYICTDCSIFNTGETKIDSGFPSKLDVELTLRTDLGHTQKFDIRVFSPDLTVK